MERLDDYTRRLWRENELQMALETAERHLLRTHTYPTRKIAGIAVTHKKRIVASGLVFRLPVALLAEHDPGVPLGRVAGPTVKGDELVFEAELCNSAQLPAAEAAWECLLLEKQLAVSVAWSDACHNNEGIVVAARLDEISLCQEGKDSGARVTKAWQRHNAIRLNEPNQVVIYDETRGRSR